MGTYQRANKPPPAGRYTAFLACLILGLLGSAVGHSHSWYDPLCCSEKDCAPLGADSTIALTEGGYTVRLTENSDPVFFPSEKLKASQDGRWHACIGAGGYPYCLYAPMGS